MKRIVLILLGLVCTLLSGSFAPAVHANTLLVGPGQQYAAPCAAITAASVGDTIQIDSSGNYAGDVCAWSTDSLTIIGVGSGRAVLNAAGQNSQGKGIWVISGNNTIVENIEFTGATVPDGNGAGIRAQGNNLTIRNCYFHDNQDGILTNAGNSVIIIEFTEFYHNGAGDGQTHNVYIGNITQLIFRYNYSHDAVVGHLLKSRAAENDIYYNRITDETAGTASYEIDLPNGGLSYIIGNLVEKGPNAQNSTLVTYQEEGANAGNPSHQLFVVNNTMVNDYGHGNFVNVDSSVSVPAVLTNNIFQGGGTIVTQSSAVQSNNFAGNAMLVSPTTYNYQLQSGSPAIDAGTNPGQGNGVSLTPVYEYVQDLCAQGRVIAGSAIDIGAYEFNGGTGVPPPNAPAACLANFTPAPAVSFSPTGLTFSSQTIGTTSPSQPVTLTNSGNASLTISGISITGTNAADFAQTNTCGATLAAAASCAINVTFTPSAGGTRSASISVSDNANASPQAATLSGTGATIAPAASLSPSGLTFAAQAPGTTSASKPLTLTNSGNASLSISSISASGDFAQTNNCGSALAAGGSCTINVTFSPTASGTRTGTLSVADNAPVSPQTASLTGTGSGSGGSPTATVSPSSLSFSGQLVGSSGSGQQVKLTNSGTAALTISSISASGDFSETNTCGASLAAGSNCAITVTFKPTAGGTRTGAITVSDNASPTPQTVTLSGAGMDFSISTSSGPSAINAGQTASASLAITPDGGFAQAVALTCTGAPADSVCTLGTNSVTPNGAGATTVSISISTTARSSLLPGVRTSPGPRSWPGFRFVPGLRSVPSLRTLPAVVALRILLLFLIFGALWKASPRTSRRLLLGFCTLILAAVFGSGCVGVVGTGSAPPHATGTPAGSYTLTLTGASGALSHSTQITLKVN